MRSAHVPCGVTPRLAYCLWTRVLAITLTRPSSNTDPNVHFLVHLRRAIHAFRFAEGCVLDREFALRGFSVIFSTVRRIRRRRLLSLKSAHLPAIDSPQDAPQLLNFPSVMDYSPYPAYRSASMPNSHHPPRTSPFNAPPKRDSVFMASEGPITPPLSPGHSEDEEPISVDPEPRYSGPSPNTSGAYLQPLTDHRRTSREMLQTEERMEVDAKRLSNSPRAPPARHLEDEKPHLEETGTLKLTDFEVKGTLGASQRLLRWSWSHNSLSRNGYIWSRTPGQAPRGIPSCLSKLFRP